MPTTATTLCLGAGATVGSPHAGKGCVQAPLVSVLMPAFAAQATIASALHSVQRQTFRDWECIVVDDGSSDTTSSIVADIAAVDRRITLVSRPHAGVVATLNAGIAHCKGQYIARMDADDLMHRHRLAAQLEVLENTQSLSAVGCHVRLFPRAHLQPGWLAYEQWLNRIDSPAAVAREIFVESPLAHPTLMIRRSLLAEYGYRDLGWPEDYDLLLRLHADAHLIGMVPRRLLCWRDSPLRVSRTQDHCRSEVFALCKASFLASGFLATNERYTLWGYGATGRALRAALAAQGKQMAYLVDMHPGRRGNRIHGAPVLSPDEVQHSERLPIIASVAGLHPRNQIRRFLEERGRHEGIDFICAA